MPTTTAAAAAAPVVTVLLWFHTHVKVVFHHACRDSWMHRGASLEKGTATRSTSTHR